MKNKLKILTILTLSIVIQEITFSILSVGSIGDVIYKIIYSAIIAIIIDIIANIVKKNVYVFFLIPI